MLHAIRFMEAVADRWSEMIEKVRSQIGFEVPEPAVRHALSESWYDVDDAVKFLNDNPGFLARPVTVVRAITSTGSRVLAPMKQEGFGDSCLSDEMGLKSKAKEGPVDLGFPNQNPAKAGNGFDNSGEAAQPLEELNMKKEVKEEVDVEPESQVSVEGVDSDDRNPAKAENGSGDSGEAAQPLEKLNMNKEVKEEVDVVPDRQVSVEEVDSDGSRPLSSQTQMEEPMSNRRPSWEAGYEEFLKATDTKVMSKEEYLKSIVAQDPSIQAEGSKVTQDLACANKVSDKKEVVTPVSVNEVVSDGSRVLSSPTQMEASICNRKPSWEAGYEEFLKETDTKVMSKEECLNSIVAHETSIQAEGPKVTQDLACANKVSEQKEVIASVSVKEVDSDGSRPLSSQTQMEESVCSSWEAEGPKVTQDLACANKVSEKKVVTPVCDEVKILKVSSIPGFQKSSQENKGRVEERPPNVEDGDFPEDPDWFLAGRTIVTALSTTKGRKLVDNEIVHFNFSNPFSRNSKWILRISTKRSGEVGRLPMEWANEVLPLVRSARVMVKGRCVAAPPVLHMMQEILVCVSFYIHHSVLSSSEVNTSWKLDGSTYIDPSVCPLPTLFRLIEMKPYQNAAFTPEELDSRKRLFSLRGNSDEVASDLPVLKRRKGCAPDQDDDEQAVSQSSLNKLVGAAEVYDLEEMEAPSTLMCDLKPYQKQALYWMSEIEEGTYAQQAESTLHPCWAAYCINDERASTIYVNNFTGEATTKLPPAFRLPRGGILADAMGLGKTVMTIALILARQGRGESTGRGKRKQGYHTDPAFKADGGTLIVCPMALLGQWKDELETHSKPGSLSIFVHYGGDRTNDPRVISGHDVVLTTYGVLAGAYKTYRENSIYNRVHWHRVVLDEAHSIKAHKTHAAQAAFTLTSHCRWCLTGTPLQNSLEDLFSLLCFLHVEPWGNFVWFNKLVQRPYESGDPRGLKLVKAILKPLMLRRTKETKDKCGRPILDLPPTDIQLVECEQSEAESEFYNALFRKSKHQFDQYLGQGKVLNNYASILELLLRLRQCCNHPFLITSRGDSKKPVDLDELSRRLDRLSRRLLEFNSNSSTNQNISSRAYIDDAIEAIRKGEKLECPICLESADDPVFTPCAHRMCRECLLSSWSTPMSGPCPLCRQILNQIDLIRCPFENQFMVADVEKDWKESSKVSKLLEYLEYLQKYRTGEKSIVFSQWTAFLDLLEIPLKRKRIGFLRFDGSLIQKHRERVLKEFNESKEKRVLLMSLKAGGVGLNLTAASNVFIMDPWWNPAVEEQAIMRIHRIGQKRTVVVKRFIVKDTVEERLQQVQARKQKMISGALTDEEVRSARIEDLIMLFS